MRFHMPALLVAAPRALRLSAGGFSLIELIITIVLVGTLAAVGSSMIADSFRTTRMVNADTASVEQARYAIERMAREIREIKYATDRAAPAAPTYCSPGVTNRYCITAPDPLPVNSPATSATVQILPPQGGSAGTMTFVNDADATVTVSGTLSKSINLNGIPLATNVDSLYFDFETLKYPADTTPVTKSNVRFVVIRLRITDPESGQPIEQRTRVSLRNE